MSVNSAVSSIVQEINPYNNLKGALTKIKDDALLTIASSASKFERPKTAYY